MIRVGLIHFQTWPDIRVVKFASALAGAGMQVDVLARDAVSGDDPRGKHPYGASEEPDGVTIRTLNAPSASKLQRATGMPYFVNPRWIKAISELLDDGCDVLIVRDFHLVLTATRLAHGRGVPVLFDMAENYPAVMETWRDLEGRKAAVKNSIVRNIALARKIERASARAADRVVVVVPEHRNRVLQLGARPPVEVVENTPVLAEIVAGVRAPEPHDELRIVYTGEIHFGRGIATMIDAAVQLRDDNVVFDLVGTGKGLAELAALARTKGVANIVTFHGWQKDLRPWIARADVGIIAPPATPHWQMTMPNKLYDYMALGKPVVVSDPEPMRRVVEDSDCGIVFEAEDATSLAVAVRKLRDPGLRDRLGNRGHQAVVDTYNWGRDGARLVEIVTQLAQRQSAEYRESQRSEAAP